MIIQFDRDDINIVTMNQISDLFDEDNKNDNCIIIMQDGLNLLNNNFEFFFRRLSEDINIYIYSNELKKLKEIQKKYNYLKILTKKELVNLYIKNIPKWRIKNTF